MNQNSRWRNMGLWCSLISTIVLTLKAFGVEIIPSEELQTIIQSVLSVLVFAGVISNPKDGIGYTDTN